ncbi:hypothetical protein NX059_000852 [Plenodomus lindquistii]|nr:hypothetical protein NX059_000852 [Plenodomus lindquistii]
MPDGLPEAEKDIIRKRRSVEAYKKRSIRLGGPEHMAMLATLHDTSSDDTRVDNIPELPTCPRSGSSDPGKSPSSNPGNPVDRTCCLASRPTDWRVKAKRIIEKKQWSFDKEMSRSTWKQKVSNDQRLLLLENDGYDISELLTKGTTADEIIDAILECVNTRKKARLGAMVSASPTSPVVDEERLAFEPNNKMSIQIFAADLNSMDYDIWDGDTLVDDDLLEAAQERPVFVTTPVIGRKRKHTDEYNDHPRCKMDHQGVDHGVPRDYNNDCLFDRYTKISTSDCFCGPIRKQARTKDVGTMEREEQKLIRNLRRTYALRSIFAESRLALSCARTINNGVYAPSFSEVLFTPPMLLSHPGVLVASRINSQGLHFVLDELIYLSAEQRTDDGLMLRDPDQEQCPIKVVCQGPRNPIRLSGETLVLKGLFNRLKDCKLLHTSQSRRVELFSWEMMGEEGSFDGQTEKELALIIEKLSVGEAYHVAPLAVRQYNHGGVKLRWV